MFIAFIGYASAGIAIALIVLVGLGVSAQKKHSK
jgi:hypothetical protein